MNDRTFPAFPAPRVAPHAMHAFGGIWRLTIRRFFALRHWLTLAGLLTVLVVFSFAMAPNRTEDARGFVSWIANFHVCFLVPIFAFVSGAGAIRDDLAAGSVDYLFTRPVRRPTYLAFRYVAHVACAQIDFLFALITLMGVGLYRGVPDLWTAVPLLFLAQVIVIGVFSAFGFLCGMLTSRYVIVGLIYGAVVEVGLGNVPTQLSRISMTRHVLGLLQSLVPRDHGSVANVLMADPLGPIASVAVLLLLTGVMIGAAALIFQTKELMGAPGRDH